MAFYAKGSPGSFLHLTQTADARAGITDDTIFHSSMPYVMFEGVWETTLTNLPASATTRGITAGSTAYFDTRLVNYLPELRVGNIPAGAIAALNDPTAVVLTEIEFVIGGVTYTKIVSGVTIEAGRHNINMDGYNAAWTTSITPRAGLDAYIGYYKGGITKDPRELIAANGSFGFETYHLRGCSNEGNGYGATEAYQIGFNYNNKRVYQPKSRFINTNCQGRSFDTVAIAPMCRHSNPDMVPLANSSNKIFQTVVETWGRPPVIANRWEWGYEGIRIPMAVTFNNEFVGTGSSTRDSYGETSKYTNITYTKVRWYKLNLRFNIGSGFSVSNALVPSTGEVKISGSEFVVGGKKLNTLTGGILYQVNKKNRPNLKLMTAGNNYSSTTWTANRGVFPVSGISATGAMGYSGVDAKSTIIPNTGMASSYLAIINPGSSTKWFCTKDTIGDQHGVIWGSGGNKALQLIPGRTAKATINSATKPISPNTNTSQMVAKIPLGLPRSGDATVVIAVTTSDYKTVLPSDSYFLSFLNRYWSNNGKETFGDPKFFFLPSDAPWPETKVGDHSILNLPINKFVPFMIHRFNNMETLWWDTPSNRGRHWTLSYWLKNAGDGSVEVHMTQKQDSEYSLYAGSVADYFTQLFHIPALNVYVQRLT